MIGLVIAEKEETGNLLKTIKAKTIEFNGTRFYLGSYNEKQVLVCFSGCGKVNAAAAAMNMIINFNVDKIFNIGLCGTAKTNLLPGDVLIADKIEYNDFDMTPLNYQLNQVPNEPCFYEIKLENVNLLKEVIGKATVGTIATGDSFVTIDNVESFPSLANKEVVGFEMEAVAIAQVCAKTKTDFICAKMVSDNLTLDASSKDQYRKSFKEMGKNIEKICLNLISKVN